MKDPAPHIALRSEIHVWTTDPNAISPKELVSEYLPLLDFEERDRYQRFHFDHDRLNYLAAHALLRMALSKYAPCHPEQWRFVRGVNGKPAISLDSGLPPLLFNLSHTSDMVACIITYQCQCGIDIEKIQPFSYMQSAMRTVFSDSEITYVEMHDVAAWPQHFFALWTLKEAYAKALGLGLSEALRRISFNIDTLHPGVYFLDGEEKNSTQWMFYSYKPTTSHQLAIAVKPTAPIANIVCRNFDL